MFYTALLSNTGALSGIPMPAASGYVLTGHEGAWLMLFILFCSLSEEQGASSLQPDSLDSPPPPPGPPPPDLVEYNVIESSSAPAVAKSVRFAEQSVPEQPLSVLDQSDSDVESSGEESDEDNPGEDDKQESNEGRNMAKAPLKDPPGPPPGQPPTLPQAPPPAPPGPPPLLRQTFPMGPRFGMPPGPPPAPPNFISMPRPLMARSQAVVSAPPTRIKSGAVETKPAGAVISAQPQLRNMTAEVTKFMPTSLRVRRDHPKTGKPKLKLGQQEQTQQSASGRGQGVSAMHVQGDAYDTFMHEMQGFL